MLRPPIDARLKELIVQVCVETRSELLELEIMPDHVHLVVECDPQFGINRLVRSMKGRSSRVLRAQFANLRSRIPCLWTGSYFLSTVSAGSPGARIRHYIQNQKHS